MSTPISSRFSPRQVPAERLEALFCGAPRQQVVRQIVDDVLATRDAGGARYEVVVAPRGAGKSHVMALVEHRLRTHPRRGDLVLASLTEEEHPSGFVDLLARLLQSLPDEPGLPRPSEQIAQLRRTPRGQQEDSAERMLRARVGDRPVCVLVENLDRVFRAIGEAGQQRLRALLEGAGRWSVIATSCTFREPFKSSKAPFYQTFNRVSLPDFTDPDAWQMLVKLAREHRDRDLETQLVAVGGRSRVAAMRALLGGNPRAMAILFPFLRNRRLDDLEGTFFDLSEELTPYFQDAMSRLPEGQRPYLELLAGSWAPMTVSELAEATFSSPQTASGQLRYLRQDLHVTCNSVGRESFYEVAEPLFRLALCMKRPDRAPATLARFLASWLERREVLDRWTLAGAREALDDPWFLALRPQAEEGTAYERAVVAEIEREWNNGAQESAIERAQAVWLAHHFPEVGKRLLLCLATTRPREASAFASELIDVSGLSTCSLTVWVASRQAGFPISAAAESAGRHALLRALDAGDALAGSMLLLAEDLDESTRSRGLACAPRLSARERAWLIERLESQGREVDVWTIASQTGTDDLSFSARVSVLICAMRMGTLTQLQPEQLVNGLEGAERDALLAAWHWCQGDRSRAFALGKQVLLGDASPFATHTAARILAEAVDVEDRLLGLRRLVVLTPEREKVYSNLILALLATNRFAEIAEALTQAPAALGLLARPILALRAGEPCLDWLRFAVTTQEDVLSAGLLIEILDQPDTSPNADPRLLTTLVKADPAWEGRLFGVLLFKIGTSWRDDGHPTLLPGIRVRLGAAFPEAAWLAALDALGALPEDTRPFRLLPSTMRQAVRTVFAAEFPTLLPHLPPEPEPEDA